MHTNISNITPPRQNSSNPDPFSIATRIVTTSLPTAGNSNDKSFLLPSMPYQQDISRAEQPIDTNRLHSGPDQTHHRLSAHLVEPAGDFLDSSEGFIIPATVAGVSKNSDTIINDCSGNSSNLQDDTSKGKKRNKISKKNGKLDARSKLEKSRQSARECRARKKLRYQYLEDLVCNREKAVVKLREELAMFCELSKRIDSGSINDTDRKLLLDQNTDRS